ncbi:MAG: FKBP-type peptidyl-prolyl cis-trans isomerase [Bacteroidaceae bacterium]|jgi:FKBP-type peptidyl-prolyl cis-trans isomerase FklB|nr:FKBP-type peptidyl-prolyl cis-trans isomerase [Bacteroidaceae bacterium]
MKKLNVLMAGMAVAALVSCTGGAGTGKVTMNDVKDTISYSIGMGRAVRVYRDQLPYDIVDSVTMKSFIKGFLEAAKDPEDKAGLAYALGYEIGSQEMSQAFVGLSEQLFGTDGGTFNKSNYISGFCDGLMENWKYMSFEEADETSNRLYEVLTQQQYDKVRDENAAYLEKKAKEDDVFKTESGLLYQVVKLGDGGPKPTETSDVEVRYRGELIDGTMFDESKEPVTLNLSRVIPGWTEGLQLMSVGDKYKFFIPYDLAYGERGQGSIKPFATLIFDVELVNIK